MSAITVLGNARRACSGPTRRETLKVGALSLLGGLFNTESLLALENSHNPYLRPGRAKSVVLLYLQGGPPTQDMFDLKPHAPGGVGGEFKPIATSAPGVEICELLPRTARWMHKSAIVRSVYHNGGCHKNLPMYTGFDVNLPDEEFRDSDPPSMGSVCAYLERDRQKELPTYAYLPCPLGWGEVRKKAGPHGGFLGRRYDPFCTECTAYVDHPPDEIWKPQVVRGEPRLRDTELLEGITLDRLKDRRRLVEPFDEEFRKLEAQRDLGNFPREQRLAFEMLTSAKVREAFDLSREDARARDRYGRTLVRLDDAAGPAAGRAGRAVRQRELGQLFQAVRSEQGRLGHARTQFPHAAGNAAAEFRPDLFGLHRGPRRPRTARRDAGGDDGRNGAHARRSTPTAAATTGRTAIRCCWPAPASGAGRSTAPRTIRPPSSRTSRCTSATSARRSITCWASTQRCPSTTAPTAPSRSPKAVVRSRTFCSNRRSANPRTA